MTPADELRAAATALRTLAAAASTDNRGTPTARWHFKERTGLDSGYLYAENPDGPGVRLILGGASGPNGRGAHPGMRTRHGEYAAAVDPTVGLALAELLDTAAEYVDTEAVAHPTHLTRALAVARQLNGGQQ